MYTMFVFEHYVRFGYTARGMIVNNQT